MHKWEEALFDRWIENLLYEFYNPKMARERADRANAKEGRQRAGNIFQPHNFSSLGAISEWLLAF